jgi:hypothetical protein
MDAIDARLERLAGQRFRQKFHLAGRDRGLAQLHGPARLRQHAREILERRVAPAAPYKDGKQTPYRGHPVFVAQHATATCCRTCLARWHEIPAGRDLTPEEIDYAVEVIARWIDGELSASSTRDRKSA